MKELAAEVGLQLVQLSPEGQQGRMHGRASRVGPEQSGGDQVARRRRLGALSEVDDQRGLAFQALRSRLPWQSQARRRGGLVLTSFPGRGRIAPLHPFLPRGTEMTW